MILAALAAISAGCGNYSTEDLRFLSALPLKKDLTVVVPASTGSGPTGLVGVQAVSANCPTLGDATVWQWAKPTSDNLNDAVGWLVGLIDAIRKYPPTDRSTDSRRWGPFDDDNHPGHEIQVVIDRTWPSGTDGPPTYAYRFEARVTGTTAFTSLLWGTFVGGSSAHGSGTLTLDFQAFWDVGVNDSTTPTTGTWSVVYDRASDPVTIDLDLVTGAAGGFGVDSFAYGYTGYASGSGAFDYRFTNGGDVLVVATGYAATNAGRLHVDFTGKLGNTGYFNQCFDANGCLVYVEDPLNLSGSCATSPCGSLAACAAVPIAPF